MKYIVIWALFNIHTQTLSKVRVEEPMEQLSAAECSQALADKGAQKPDKDGNIKLYECIEVLQ